MRELKFRAWDNGINAWHIWKTIPLVIDDHPEIYELFSLDGLSIIEQYIEQKDKNGKEVYEGDILRTDENNWVAKVIYNYGGFMLVGLDDKGFSCNPSYRKCEIIGNIHEGIKGE
jgi:hypothetical protein